MSDMPPQVPVVPSGEFRVGRVLSRSFKILFHDFVKFVLIALLATVPPALIFGGWIGAPSFLKFQYLPPAVSIFLLSSLVNLPFRTLAQAATYYGASQDLRDQPFRLGKALARGFERFFPLLGVAMAWGFVVLAGFILLVVPGFMWLTRFYVSLPACVMEGTGPLESMSRSSLLTDGHRWKLLALYLLLFAIGGVVGAIMGAIFGITGGALVGAAARPFIALCTLIWSTLFAAYYSIAVAVIYHDLRALKDGIDIDRVAAVFD